MALGGAYESIAVLKRWKTKQLELKIKCGPAWTENGFVFIKDDGTFMHPDSITAWLRRFSKENDLPHIHTICSANLFESESCFSLGAELQREITAQLGCLIE